jgi:hypothetical protein
MPPPPKSKRQLELDEERERRRIEKLKAEENKPPSLKQRQAELDTGNGMFTWDPNWTGNNLALDPHHFNTATCQFKTIGLGMGQCVRSKQRMEPNSGQYYFLLEWNQFEEVPWRNVMGKAIHGEVQSKNHYLYTFP